MTSIPCASSTLVRANTFRTSSSTIRIFLSLKTSSAEWSCSSRRRFSCGSFRSTRWRKSAVSSSSRSGELAQLRRLLARQLLAGVDDHRRGSGTLVLLQALEQLEAAELRQLQVDDHAVITLQLQRLERVLAGADCGHLDVLAAPD